MRNVLNISTVRSLVIKLCLKVYIFLVILVKEFRPLFFLHICQYLSYILPNIKENGHINNYNNNQRASVCVCVLGAGGGIVYCMHVSLYWKQESKY